MEILIFPPTRVERKPNGVKIVDDEEEEEEEETVAEKRLRLAKEYIAQIEEEGNSAIIVIYSKSHSQCKQLW